jgi:hypothetical protein
VAHAAGEEIGGQLDLEGVPKDEQEALAERFARLGAGLDRADITAGGTPIAVWAFFALGHPVRELCRREDEQPIQDALYRLIHCVQCRKTQGVPAVIEKREEST